MPGLSFSPLPPCTLWSRELSTVTSNASPVSKVLPQSRVRRWPGEARGRRSARHLCTLLGSWGSGRFVQLSSWFTAEAGPLHRRGGVWAPHRFEEGAGPGGVSAGSASQWIWSREGQAGAGGLPQQATHSKGAPRVPQQGPELELTWPPRPASRLDQDVAGHPSSLSRPGGRLTITLLAQFSQNLFSNYQPGYGKKQQPAHAKEWTKSPLQKTSSQGHSMAR